MEYTLLGLLAEQPMHGYDLHKALLRMEGIGLVWRIRQAALYAALDRLAVEGLVKAHPSEGQLITRKELSLTPAGRNAFDQWRATPVGHPRQMRQEFLARLFFAQRDSVQQAQQLIRAQMTECQQWLDGLENQLGKLPESAHYESWVFRFRIASITAMQSWLNGVASSLEDSISPKSEDSHQLQDKTIVI